MALNADDLPREGIGGQHLIDSLTMKVGANNTLDVIMKNLPQIARSVGARRPDYHPTHDELNLIKNKNVAALQKPSEFPDVPKSLHTPPAVMMPGANTEPGKMLSKEDVDSFNRVVSESSAKLNSVRNNGFTNHYLNFEQNQNSNPMNRDQIINQVQRASYFKDSIGNEYKILGNSLYVLGWQDASVKVRMVNSETGKEIPSKGRKFQIYGWHLVQKVNESETDSEINRLESETDVTQFERDVSIDSYTNSETEKALTEKQTIKIAEPLDNEIKPSIKKTVAESEPVWKGDVVLHETESTTQIEQNSVGSGVENEESTEHKTEQKMKQKNKNKKRLL